MPNQDIQDINYTDPNSIVPEAYQSEKCYSPIRSVRRYTGFSQGFWYPDANDCS